MTPTVSPPIAAPPDDPVRAALNDPALQVQLDRQAKSFFRRHFSSRPTAFQLEAAQEAFQEACERVLEKKAKFDPAKGTPAGWIHGVFATVCCEKSRKIGGRHQQLLDDPAVWDSLEARLEPDRGSEELSALMRDLKDEDRQMLTLAYLEELSHVQIAEKLGISRGNSRVRLSRALESLRLLVNEKEGGR